MVLDVIVIIVIPLHHYDDSYLLFDSKCEDICVAIISEDNHTKRGYVSPIV
jgi:hypothetical protein